MRGLISFFLQLALLAIFTFAFVVLFEHGPQKFAQGAKAEWNSLLFFVGSVLSKEQNPPTAAGTTPAPTPPAGTSPPKKMQAGENTNRPTRATPVQIR